MIRTLQKLPPFNQAATSLAKTQLPIAGSPEKALNFFFFFWFSHCQLCELWRPGGNIQRCLLERASQRRNPELRSQSRSYNRDTGAVLVQRAVRLPHVEREVQRRKNKLGTEALRTFAWINCAERTWFFFSRVCSRGERERERERERESRLTAGVNFVFSGFLNDPRRDKRDSQCRWEELGAAKRTVHRTDQSRAYRRRQGFPCHLFLASQLNGRTSSAEWRRRRNNFSPCFSLLESHIFSWKVFHGFQQGQVHSRKHKLSKNYFWRWSSPGSPPAGLN